MHRMKIGLVAAAVLFVFTALAEILGCYLPYLWAGILQVQPSRSAGWARSRRATCCPCRRRDDKR